MPIKSFYARQKNALKQRKNGASVEQALALVSNENTYKVNQPASEAQIRQWRNSGFTPQDIITAEFSGELEGQIY